MGGSDSSETPLSLSFKDHDVEIIKLYFNQLYEYFNINGPVKKGSIPTLSSSISLCSMINNTNHFAYKTY